MNKRETLGIVFIILCFALYCALSVSELMVKDRTITIDRLREINYIFEQHQRGEIDLTGKELYDLIKEYHKPIREVKQ